MNNQDCEKFAKSRKRLRIKELAEHAGFKEAWFSESGDDCFSEIKKFAELIIQECSMVSLKSSHRNDDMGAIIARHIQEHFGVE